MTSELEHEYGMLVDQALRDFLVDSNYAASVITKAKTLESRRSGRKEVSDD